MERTTEYYETQRFTQAWVRIILVGCLLLGIIVSGILVYSTRNGVLALLPVVICSAIFALMRSIKMVVDINEETISYQFFPFQLKKRVIQKGEISQLSIDKYDPLGDYGGWGIR